MSKRKLGLGVFLLAAGVASSSCVVEVTTVYAGDACDKDHECATGLVCATSGPNPGTCVAVTPPPPTNDVTLEVEWTINGGAATTDSCLAAGIAQVRIAIADQSGGNIQEVATSPCAGGKFDSRPMALLKAGSYQSSLRAYDSMGTLLNMSPFATLVVNSGQHATLLAVDFVSVPTNDVTLEVDWTINGGAATTTSCMGAGIAQVRIAIADATGGNIREIAMSPCAGGKYDSRPAAVLQAGSYQSSLRAYDSMGVLLNMSPFAALVVNSGQHAILLPVDFVVVGPTGLAIMIRWDRDPTPTMVDGTCAEANVGTVSFTLRDGATHMPVTGGTLRDIMCTEMATFTDVAPGTYELYVEGSPPGSVVKNWMGTCTALMVNDGELAMYNCFVDRVM